MHEPRSSNNNVPSFPSFDSQQKPSVNLGKVILQSARVTYGKMKHTWANSERMNMDWITHDMWFYT